MPQRRRPLKLPVAKVSYLVDLGQAPNAVLHKSQDAVERVKKCFARAKHQNANEQEAKAALTMAARIMNQHNISQADVMIAEESSERAKRGGISSVDIIPTGENSRPSIPGWLYLVVGAIQDTFECRSISEDKGDRITWSFYGVAEHTISAAIALEAVHNQIQEWSQKYTGVAKRNSYCLGIGDELLDLSDQELKLREREARRNEEDNLATRIKDEEAMRQAELNRLKNEPLEPISGSEDNNADCVDDSCNDDGDESMDDGPNESGIDLLNEPAFDEASDNEVQPDLSDRIKDENLHDVDIKADFDAELQKIKDAAASKPDYGSRDARHARRQQYSSNPVTTTTLPTVEDINSHPIPPTSSDNETPQWKSTRQLQLYREKSRDVEDQVLKENNIKLSKGRKWKRSCRDPEAYRRGRKDGKKIELRAARIEGNSEDINGADRMDLDNE